MGSAVDLVSEWTGDPGAVVDYQTRFTRPVPVPDAATGSPDEATATLEVTGRVGKLDQEAQTARIDLTVELLHGEERTRVLAKSQALVVLTQR